VVEYIDGMEGFSCSCEVMLTSEHRRVVTS